MLSLIICSTHKETDANLLRNIKNTISTEYEIIHIDNSQNKYNIFQAYNIGADKSQGDILCFMHEDLVFHTKGWGAKVEEIFLKHPMTGLFGVAGGKVIPARGDWRMIPEYIVQHYVQGYWSIETIPVYFSVNSFYNDKHTQENIIDVVALDGMWLCMPRRLYPQIHFDDKTFNNFHLYDTDISIQIKQAGYNVGVTTDIIIEHRSEGTFRESFLAENRKLLKKWGNTLPLHTPSITIPPQEQDKLDTIADQRLFCHIVKQQKEAELRKKLKGIKPSEIQRELGEDDFIFLSNYTYWRIKSTVIKNKKIGLIKALRLLSEAKCYLTDKTYSKLRRKLFAYKLMNLLTTTF